MCMTVLMRNIPPRILHVKGKNVEENKETTAHFYPAKKKKKHGRERICRTTAEMCWLDVK